MNNNPRFLKHLHSFAQFLAPLSPQDFFRDFAGKRPFHLQRDPELVHGLFDWSALNTVLRYSPAAPPHVRMSKGGKKLPETDFSRRIVNTFKEDSSHPLLAELSDLLRDGGTLIVSFTPRRHPNLARLCRVLETAILGEVEAGIFATFNAVPGLSTHWDTEDVFVLQLEGEKLWKIFEPERKHPIEKDRKLAHAPPSEIYWTGILKPGDLLYIPRGWWHDATATGDLSLHVSFGLHPPTGIELLQWIADKLSDNELVRANVPLASPEGARSYVESLQHFLIRTLQATTLDAFLHELNARALTAGTLSLPWNAAPTAIPLPEDAHLTWLPPRPAVLKMTDEKIAFEAFGTTFSFSSLAAPVLEDLIKHQHVSLTDLSERHAGMDVKNFVLQLVTVGLLTINID